MQTLSFCLCASRFRCAAASIPTLLLVEAGGWRAADSTGVSVGGVFWSCGWGTQCATTAVVGWGSIPLQQIGAFGVFRAVPIAVGLSLVCPCCWVTMGLGSALPCRDHCLWGEADGESQEKKHCTCTHLHCGWLLGMERKRSFALLLSTCSHSA